MSIQVNPFLKFFNRRLQPLSYPLCFVSMVSLLPISLQASERPKLIIEDEVVITANRFAQHNLDINAAITVIDSETIAAAQTNDLVSLLSSVPGLNFGRSGGRGSQTSVFTRGTDSDHTLILVDGVKYNDLSSGTSRLEFLNINSIERIEIVRGARSSLYGSEAIGGVIQIFTKPAHQAEENSFTPKMTVSLGTEDSRSVSLAAHGRWEQTLFSAQLGTEETDGIDSRSTIEPDDDGYSNENSYLSLQQLINEDLSVELNYSYVDADNQFDSSSPDAESRFRNESYHLGTKWQLNDVWLSTLGLTKYTSDYVDNTFGGYSDESDRHLLNWQNTFSWTGQNLIIGYERANEAFRNTFVAERKRINDAVYIYSGTELKALDVELSLRYDDNENFGDALTGSLTLGVDLGDSATSWLSVGTAFKAPNFFDLFGFGGDPGLEPEESKNFELGYRKVLDNVLFNASLFRNEIDELIIFTTQVENAEKAVINGIELSTTVALDDFTFGASYTALDPKNESKDTLLARRSRHTAAFDAAYALSDDTNITLATYSQSQRKDSDFNQFVLGGYTIANLIVQHQLNDNASIGFRLDNVFDKEYQLADTFNSYGRTFLFSFNYRPQ